MGQRAQSPPPPLPPLGAEPPRSVAEATLAFSPGQRSDSTTAGSAGPGPLGPWGAVGSLPGLLQLLEAPVPRGQWPPHSASDSFSGPRGSLAQGPAWGQLGLRGLHVVPPAVSSLGGPRLRLLGLRTGSLSWGRVLPSLGAAPSAVWPLCGDHRPLSAGAPGGRRAGSASRDGGTETSCRPFWWPLRPRRPYPPGSLWPACWAPGRVSGSQVTALLWAVRQATHPARDPGTLTSCPQVRGGRQLSPRPLGAAA